MPKGIRDDSIYPDRDIPPPLPLRWFVWLGCGSTMCDLPPTFHNLRGYRGDIFNTQIREKSTGRERRRAPCQHASRRLRAALFPVGMRSAADTGRLRENVRSSRRGGLPSPPVSFATFNLAFRDGPLQLLALLLALEPEQRFPDLKATFITNREEVVWREHGEGRDFSGRRVLDKGVTHQNTRALFWVRVWGIYSAFVWNGTVHLWKSTSWFQTQLQPNCRSFV